MPECPRCGKEIDHLIFDGSEEMSATVVLNSKGLVDYINWQSFGINDGEYKCPECGEVLFTDEGDAEAFLRGKLKDKGGK